MSLFDEIDLAIAEGLEAFKKLIQQKLETKPNLLRFIFCLKNGEQRTVLNHLILSHNAEERDLTEHVKFLFEQGASTHIDEPAHLAYKHKKPGLARQVLKWAEEHVEVRVLVDDYDPERKTLLARAIDTGEIDSFHDVLASKPDVNKPSKIQISKETISIPPLHHAIMKNFTAAVSELLAAGAGVDNLCGNLQETPLLLAARLGRIDSLKSILESKARNLDLEASNTESKRAIDLLCIRLQAGQDPQGALRGIALLLCHGAAVPQQQNLCTLLRDNRSALLVEVQKYAEKAPELAAKFIRVCHSKSPLRSIIYAENSWWESFRHFFARPSQVALNLESIVLKTQPPKKKKEEAVLEGAPAPFSEEEVQFAQFVEKYDAALSIKKFLGVTLFNPWSTMRWKIERGEITSMEQVRSYAATYSGTRTDQILKLIDQPKDTIHENLGNSILQ